MENKKREHAVNVMNEILSEVRPDVIKNYDMPTLCNVQTAKVTGFAVVMTLSTRYDYTSENLEDWRKRLDADDYYISVNCNRLLVRFNIMMRRKRR